MPIGSPSYSGTCGYQEAERISDAGFVNEPPRVKRGSLAVIGPISALSSVASAHATRRGRCESPVPRFRRRLGAGGRLLPPLNRRRSGASPLGSALDSRAWRADSHPLAALPVYPSRCCVRCQSIPEPLTLKPTSPPRRQATLPRARRLLASGHGYALRKRCNRTPNKNLFAPETTKIAR